MSVLALNRGIYSVTDEAGFLLDDLTYNAPLRAYSTRRLSTSYTGDALRVRRSSDNAEQDIGFVGENLDTASLLSFVGANNGFIRRMYDQSGNASDAVQATAGEQWQIVSSGTLLTFNGKASIQSTTAKEMDITTLTNVRSVSAVLNYDSINSYAPLIGDDSAYNFHGTVSGAGWVLSGTAKASIVAGAWRMNGASVSATADVKVVSTDYYVNAVATAADLRVNHWTEDRGNARGHAGHFPELILWSDDITSDISAIESNQSAYWGI